MQLDPSLSLQTSLSAIDDLSNANKYIEEILKHICIDSLGVLVDEERKKGKEDVTKKKYYFTYILWNDESDIKSEYEVNIPSSWTGFISFCKFKSDIFCDVSDRFNSLTLANCSCLFCPIVITERCICRITE